jgi:hypothetical protein
MSVGQIMLAHSTRLENQRRESTSIAHRHSAEEESRRFRINIRRTTSRRRFPALSRLTQKQRRATCHTVHCQISTRAVHYPPAKAERIDEPPPKNANSTMSERLQKSKSRLELSIIALSTTFKFGRGGLAASPRIFQVPHHTSTCLVIDQSFTDWLVHV